MHNPHKGWSCLQGCITGSGQGVCHMFPPGICIYGNTVIGKINFGVRMPGYLTPEEAEKLNRFESKKWWEFWK